MCSKIAVEIFLLFSWFSWLPSQRINHFYSTGDRLRTRRQDWMTWQCILFAHIRSLSVHEIKSFRGKWLAVVGKVWKHNSSRALALWQVFSGPGRLISVLVRFSNSRWSNRNALNTQGPVTLPKLNAWHHGVLGVAGNGCSGGPTNLWLKGKTPEIKFWIKKKNSTWGDSTDHPRSPPHFGSKKAINPQALETDAHVFATLLLVTKSPNPSMIQFFSANVNVGEENAPSSLG